MAKADELVIEIKGDVTDLLKKLKQATNGADEAGQGIGDAFGKAEKPIKGTTKLLVGFAAATATAATAMVGFGKVMDHINSKVGLIRMADRVGINVQQFQKLSFAAKTIGLDAEVLADGIKDLTVKITDASLGAQAYEDALNAIGLKSQELTKLSPEKQFLAFAEAVSKASLEMGNFAADEINDSMFRLVPLMRQGAKGFEELGKKALEAGLILSDSDFNELKKSKQAALDLENAWDGVFTQLTLTASGPLTDFLNMSKEILEVTRSIFSVQEKGAKLTVKALGTVSGATSSGGLKTGEGQGFDDFAIQGPLSQGNKFDSENKAGLDQLANLMNRSLEDSLGVRTEGEMQGPQDNIMFRNMQQNTLGGDMMTGAAGMDNGAGLGPGFGETAQDEMNRHPILGPSEEEFEAARELQLERQGILGEELAEAKREERERAEKEEQGFRNREFSAEERQIKRIIALSKGDAKNKLRLASGLANDLVNLSGGKSKKLFEISKTLGIADATVSMLAGAVKVYKDVPYPASIGAMASVLAMGASNIASIKSTSFGGGGGGGGASVPSATSLTDTIEDVQQGPTNVTEATINITGDNFSGDQVRGLWDQLKEYQEDGAEVIMK